MSKGPARFVLIVASLIALVVAVGGVGQVLQGRVTAEGAAVPIGNTLLVVAVAILALVTNVFAYIGTSRGERVSAAFTSVVFAVVTLVGLWPFALVLAPFPLLNAFFLLHNN